MNTQPTLFDKMPMPVENAPLTVAHNRHRGNQAILDDNREHFGNQTQTVLNHLLKGERVSGLMMMKLHGIQDIRPRIAAIKKLYPVQEEKIKGGHGAKEWWINNEDRIK